MKVVCVEQLNRSDSKTPLLAIGLECVFTGGLVCIFNIVASKVLRIIETKTNVSYLISRKYLQLYTSVLGLPSNVML